MSQATDTRPDQTTASRSATELPPMAAAKAPVGTGVLPVVGVVLATALTALGVVGIHDAVVAAGWVDGDAWIDSAVGVFDGWRPETWLLPAGIGLILGGLWLLLVALRPRPRTGISLQAATAVYLRPADVARLATRAASDVDGVISARSSASRRKVDVDVTVTGGSSTGDRVRAAVEEALEPLESAPKVQVQVETAGGGS